MLNKNEYSFVQGASFGLLVALSYILWSNTFIVPAIMAFLMAFALSWPFWAGAE